MATTKDFRDSTYIASDESLDFECSHCEKMNKNIVASIFCVDCNAHLCSGCTTRHSSSPLMAGHMLTVWNAKLNSTVSLIDNSIKLLHIPNERCLKHPTEFIKMYCGIHDVVACTVCTTLDHRACRDIHYIPDVVNTLYTQQMSTDIIAAFVKASEKMRTCRGALNNAVKDMNTAKHRTLQAIHTIRKEVVQMLDQLEENTKKELNDQCQKLHIQWQSLIQQTSMIIRDLQKRLDQLKNTANNKSQQFVLIKMSKETISIVDDITCQLLPCSTEITFSQNPSIKHSLEQLSSLGNLSFHINKQKFGLYNVKDVLKYNVKLKSDSQTCSIYGSCALDSGNLLLADISNIKLKLFNTRENVVTSYCTFPSQPLAVSLANDVEAAVCLLNKTIQFVSIGDPLLLTRVLQIGYQCSSLAFAADNMYATEHRNGKNLYVHAPSGELLKTINNDHLQKQIFLNSRHITARNNKIHVADFKNGLITIDTQDNIVWKYSTRALFEAYNICADDGGNVFVCGYNSNNVIQIGQDGEKLGELVLRTQCLNGAQSMCFDNRNSRLIIADESDDILVLTLQ